MFFKSMASSKGKLKIIKWQEIARGKKGRRKHVRQFNRARLLD